MFLRWRSIRVRAGLGDVTLHDLRRTCASWLSIHGENMAVIGRGVLNHTSLQHTGIYARLNVDPVVKALEANSVRMLASPRAMGTVPCPAPITPPPMMNHPAQERDEWPG